MTEIDEESIDEEFIYDEKKFLEEEYKINIDQLCIVLKSINIILIKNIQNIKLFKSNEKINKDIVNTFINYYCDMKKEILDLITNLSTETFINKDSIQFVINYYQNKKNNLKNIDILLNKYFHNEIQLGLYINNYSIDKDILPICEIVKLICNIDSIDAIIENKDYCYSINSSVISDYSYMLTDYKELYDKKFKIFTEIINLIQ
jgi:hypothetical protein